GSGGAVAEFFPMKKHGMLSRCVRLYDLSIHTASLAFAPAQRCRESLVIPKPASCDWSGREKNSLRPLRHAGAGVLRPQGAAGARSLPRRHAGVTRGGGAARGGV